MVGWLLCKDDWISQTNRRLKKTVGNTSLNILELQTMLAEIESILNSRPLTYSYTDINDGPPLTPSHFLCEHRLLTLPDTLLETEYEDSDYTLKEPAKDLTKRMKYLQKLTQAFWKQWQKEHLTNLREQRASHKNKPKSEDTVNKGKVVLIHDDTPRNQWKLGVIIQLHRGKDGLVRSVTLRTAKRNQISQPIEKLYPLEVSPEETQMEEPQLKESKDETKKETRTPRAAAQRAAQRIKELSTD